MVVRLSGAIALMLVTSAASAQMPVPKLLVVISVDQFSADLFAEYRAHWTGGMKRLSEGVVFPSGYQSHAATETCPGHATILTGDRPSRTGIIANKWRDLSVPRADKTIYCAEDETVTGTSSKDGEYVPSIVHLRAAAPTLGDRMKEYWGAAARVVAVAGKDRAAIMMGGSHADQMWFLDAGTKNRFVTLGRPGAAGAPQPVTAANVRLSRLVGAAAGPMALPLQCRTRAVPVTIAPQLTVGDGRFARAGNAVDLFRASPELDAATLDLAADFARTMALGRGTATDLLVIGLSATDFIGHRYGTEGSEMCIQLAALDRALDRFFTDLDARHVDYLVTLTADHGGHDVAERNRARGIAEDSRVEAQSFSIADIGAKIAADMGLSANPLSVAETSDVRVDTGLTPAQRTEIVKRAVVALKANTQVADAFPAADIAHTPIPASPPESWTIEERAAASYDAIRSGDVIMFLKPRVVPIAKAAPGYIATHGSPWDYDRRVPILFWRKGMTGFEQPNSIETVDIAPTLAAIIGLPVAAGAMDGRCRDLVAGAATSCPR